MNGEFIFGSQEKPFNGRKMLALVVGFFLTIIVVNGIFVWLALSTWTGLETEAPYEKGLRYNDSLAAAEAQKRLAWHLDDRIVASTDDGHRLLIDVTDVDGAPLSGLEVEIYLRRPTQADMDMQFSAGPVGTGGYAADFSAPALGNWDLIVIARDNRGGQHRKERRIWLK
jgi:nitrogen fixation protein FixH